MIKFKGLMAPCDVPTGDGRMFAAGKLTHRPLPIPVMARFGSGGHDGGVPVAKVTSIFPGPGGYWGEGYFLDPAYVPEVPRAIYMVQEKVLGPSVDLDRDFMAKVIPHPTKPDKKASLFEEYNVIGVTLVPMPAFYQVHMSIENQEEKALLASAGVDLNRFLDMDEYTNAAGAELWTGSSMKTSNFIEDEAECGCDNSIPADFSQEIVPEIGAVMKQTYTPTVTTAPSTFSVGGAIPTSVTFNFGDGYPGHMCEGKAMGGGKTILEIPEAGIKIVKMGHGEDHDDDMEEYCEFDSEGMCKRCLY